MSFKKKDEYILLTLLQAGKETSPLNITTPAFSPGFFYAPIKPDAMGILTKHYPISDLQVEYLLTVAEARDYAREGNNDAYKAKLDESEKLSRVIQELKMALYN